MSPRDRLVGPGLMYAALGAGVVSALGILMVPSIARAFEVELATAQWMLTVNLLAGVVATPVMGRLSDGPRARRVFLCSIAVIGIGSMVCAVAAEFEVFLAGRALQGLSYGLYPVAASLSRRQLSGPPLRSSLSMLAISGAVGTGLGYPITGLLAELGSFRSAFWFGAAFMGTAIVVAWWILDRAPRRGDLPRPRLDVWGAVLLGGGLTPLLFWIAEGPRIGWWSPTSILLIVASVAVLAGWLVHALHAVSPLVDVRGLMKPDVLLANFVAIAFGVAIYTIASGSGIVGQAPESTGYGHGWSVALAGFVMLPLTVGTFLGNRVVGRLRGGSTVVWSLPAGAALAVLASSVLVLMPESVWALYGGIFVMGAGMGLAYGALPLLIARSIDPDDFGSAMSFNQLLRTVGGALGGAISGAVIAGSVAGHGFPDRAGIMLNFAVPGVIALTAGLLLLAAALRQDKYD